MDYQAILDASRLPIEMEEFTMMSIVANLDSIFPEDQYPEFEIEYAPLPNGKVKVLGFGSPDDVCDQLGNLIERDPTIRELDWDLIILRSREILLL